MVWGDGRRGELEADALACLALFFIGGFRGRGDLRQGERKICRTEEESGNAGGAES